MVIKLSYIVLDLIKFAWHRIIYVAGINAVLHPYIERVSMVNLVATDAAELHNVLAVKWEHRRLQNCLASIANASQINNVVKLFTLAILA